VLGSPTLQTSPSPPRDPLVGSESGATVWYSSRAWKKQVWSSSNATTIFHVDLSPSRKCRQEALDATTLGHGTRAKKSRVVGKGNVDKAMAVAGVQPRPPQ
jgi:hypothetical protein